MAFAHSEIRDAIERVGDEHWQALIRHHEDAYPESRPTPRRRREGRCAPRRRSPPSARHDEHLVDHRHETWWARWLPRLSDGSSKAQVAIQVPRRSELRGRTLA